MSLLFAKVLQQAEKTFLTINKESLKSNLQILKSLMESLDLNDLQIDSRFVSKQEFQRKVSRFKLLSEHLQVFVSSSR